MNTQEIHGWFLKSGGISTDSRTTSDGDLFFALKGENFNGNKYVKNALEKGAVAAIVDESELEDHSKNIFAVPDSLKALQQLAAHHRQQLEIPVIALTGSNGKTTTKELLAACLEKKFKTAFTQGNLNNHIGVPLTLLSIRPEHEMAVIEMGANHRHEIAELCRIAMPDSGYITNFGKAHLEGFGGMEGVIEGKTELYDYLKANDKTVFVNTADPVQTEKTQGIHTVTFGIGTDAYFRFQSASGNGLAAVMHDNHLIESNLSGVYNEINLAAAAAIAMHFGIGIHQIQEAVRNYYPKINRSQEVEKDGRKILLDAYNANPSSMEAALKNFDALDGTKSVILGDMFELGELSLQEHHDVVKLATLLDFERIYLIGKEFMQVKIAHPCLFQFPTREVFLDFIRVEPLDTDRILIKGSRGMALEKLLGAI